jgi:hypothetical protein
MCVTPARATCAMLSAIQIPPPTAILPVTHVISILKFSSFLPETHLLPAA